MAKSARNGIAHRKEPDSFGNQDEILLGVLTVVERDANTSQRGISRELDVALGLANAYLKRCVRKGLIKIKQVPRRRYAYYLTPRGFAEKSRLAGEYFSASFTFFRRARAQMSELMSDCDRLGWRRIAFAGISDLAEVGVICAHDFPIDRRRGDRAGAGGREILRAAGRGLDCRLRAARRGHRHRLDEAGAGAAAPWAKNWAPTACWRRSSCRWRCRKSPRADSARAAE